MPMFIWELYDPIMYLHIFVYVVSVSLLASCVSSAVQGATQIGLHSMKAMHLQIT